MDLEVGRSLDGWRLERQLDTWIDREVGRYMDRLRDWQIQMDIQRGRQIYGQIESQVDIQLDRGVGRYMEEY